MKNLIILLILFTVTNLNAQKEYARAKCMNVEYYSDMGGMPNGGKVIDDLYGYSLLQSSTETEDIITITNGKEVFLELRGSIDDYRYKNRAGDNFTVFFAPACQEGMLYMWMASPDHNEQRKFLITKKIYKIE